MRKGRIKLEGKEVDDLAAPKQKWYALAFQVFLLVNDLEIIDN